MKHEYEIKISGSGTREEIAKALRIVADSVCHETSLGDGLNLEIREEGEQWEDHILMTNISKVN